MGLFFNTESIVCPCILEDEVSEALIKLSASNLTLRITEVQYRKDISKPTIVHQSPSPGKIIKRKQPIFCVIAKTAQEDAIPHYVGNTLSTIKQAWSKNYCIHYLEHTLPKNFCIAQTTEKKNNGEQAVHFFISQGSPQWYVLPDWKKTTCATIKKTLDYYFPNALVLHIGQPCATQTCSCMIIDQKPAAGTIIDISKNPTVQILVQRQ